MTQVKYARQLIVEKHQMEGEDVKAVQMALIGLGYSCGVKGANGYYGPDTEKAVKAYQRARGLKVDGKVGTITWGALFPPTADAETEIGKFTDYAQQQVGCLYVSGGQGDTMTPTLIRKLEKKDSDYKRALASYDKHVEEGTSLIAYDCSGLIIKYLLGKGYITRDYNANGIYTVLCDHISRAELQAGDFVGKKNLAGRVYHAGVYMGDGTVVNAKGRDYGVVRESINEQGWNVYGRLKVIPRPVITAQPITYTVKNGDNLQKIAAKFLGSKDRWKEIYALNKSVIGSHPELIHPGDKLIMP